MGKNVEVATLAGGCFWCLEAVFEELKGIETVVSGYSGGTVRNPSYQDVCGGDTGHAESVQVTFDPSIISYHDLLSIFFSVHDPTTLNRQGSDVGTQYRSVIFYHDEGQKEIAEQVMQEVEAAHIWADPLVTELAPMTMFFPAEDYHQEYYVNNRYQPYCQFVITPKVGKFRKQFADRLRK